MTTSTAGWVHKTKPEHVCILPRIDNQTFVGSVWRCGDCNQNWVVYSRSHHGRGGLPGVVEKSLLRISEAAAQAIASGSPDAAQLLAQEFALACKS